MSFVLGGAVVIAAWGAQGVTARDVQAGGTAARPLTVFSRFNGGTARVGAARLVIVRRGCHCLGGARRYGLGCAGVTARKRGGVDGGGMHAYFAFDYSLTDSLHVTVTFICLRLPYLNARRHTVAGDRMPIYSQPTSSMKMPASRSVAPARRGH